MSAASRTSVVWPLLVALIAGAVYVNAVPNGFALDDVPLIRDNPDLRPETDGRNLLLRPYWGEGGEVSGLYRPLTILSLRLNRALTGPGPRGFHAVNVLTHMLVCMLVWVVVRGTGRHYGTALAAAALFAVHPLHTEAVANIVGRAELLGATWVLLAWLTYRRALEAGGATNLAWTIGTGVCFLLAFLSKENTILAPVLFVLDGWFLRPVQRWRRHVSPLLACAAALTLGLAMRLQALGGLRGTDTVAFIDNPPAFLGFWTRIGTALWVQVKYLTLFFWPWTLSSDYSFNAIPVVRSTLDPRPWIGVACLALLLGSMLRYRASRPVVIGVSAWALFLFPSSNLFFVSGTVMAERLTYLPSLGGCLILGHLVAAGRARIASRRGRVIPVVACLLVLVGWSIRTIARNPDWRDNASLALHDARTMSRSAKLHAGAGIVLHARGELEAAEQAYRRALAIYSEYAQIHYNLGELLLVRGAEAEALEHLVAASRISPQNPHPHLTLAPLLESAGRIEEALEHYAAGSRLAPEDFAFRFNFGRLLLARGRMEDARQTLAKLARDDSQGVPGTVARAMVHEIDGQRAEAAAIYGALIRDPALPEEIRANLSRRLAGLEETLR